VPLTCSLRLGRGFLQPRTTILSVEGCPRWRARRIGVESTSRSRAGEPPPVRQATPGTLGKPRRADGVISRR
jgi:hypothetical protein